MYTTGHNLGEVSNTHPFSVGDFIAVVDDSTSTIDSNFLSAGTVGKVTAATGSTIATDVDASGASADYTYSWQSLDSKSGQDRSNWSAVIVEEVQVVGG